MCAGEFKIAVEVYPDGILRMKQRGCPAEIVFPNPTPAIVGGNFGINVNAPHPHAAALFVDFVLVGRRRQDSFRHGPNSEAQRRPLDVRRAGQSSKNAACRCYVVTAEQTDQVSKAMEKIMKELLVK